MQRGLTLPWRLAVLLAAARAVGLRGWAVRTASMAPACPPGSLVLVSRARPRSLRPGTVVLYQLPGAPPTLHRVVRVDLAQGRPRRIPPRCPWPACWGGAFCACPARGCPFCSPEPGRSYIPPETAQSRVDSLFTRLCSVRENVRCAFCENYSCFLAQKP